MKLQITRPFLISTMAIAALALYAAGSLFILVALTDLNHDEHQFLASAHLVADEGLHPYRDFAYFHMPLLVYGYAFFFEISENPFLLARLSTGLASFAIAALLFYELFRRLKTKNTVMQAVFTAAGILLLYLNAPIVAKASAFAWNHSTSTLTALGAVLIWLALIRREREGTPGTASSLVWIGLSGLLLGGAIGIRLSWAPLIFPLLWACWFFGPRSSSFKDRFWRVAAFGVGGVVANLPGLFFLFTETNDFLFGNLGYAELNTEYRQMLGHDQAMTWSGKLIYCLGVLCYPVGSFFIPVWATVLFWSTPANLWKHLRAHPETLFLFLVVLFTLAGSLAPTPTWSQYLFAPFPFLVLLIGIGLVNRIDSSRFRAGPWIAATACLSIFLGPLLGTPEKVGKFDGIATLDGLQQLTNPASWTPIQVEATSNYIDENVRWKYLNRSEGRILTTSPLHVMDGPESIYGDFTTGPFAWRVAPLLSDQSRAEYDVVSPEELEQQFSSAAPIALLTHGVQHPSYHAEKELRRLALQKGYLPTTIPGGYVLWTNSREGGRPARSK